MKPNYKAKPSEAVTLTDIHERITEKILSRIEAGVAPWQSAVTSGGGLPCNFISKKPYQGINVFLLAMSGYASPHWLTFKQALDCGGNVRKGEKGSFVVKYGTFQKTTGDGEKPDSGMFLKSYTVFNAAQIDGVEFPEIPQPGKDSRPPCEAAERIVDAMPMKPIINEGAFSTPHYIPAMDAVNMPARGYFSSPERFHKTLFHELTHATGHASRLARKTLMENRGMHASGEGRMTYTLEELVAEMGAAFLSAHSGIANDDHENSAAYLSGWLTVLKLKENRKWIMQAASQAQKAANFIMGVLPAPAAE